MPRPVFVSMGMLILDEIHYVDAPLVYNVLGGGGTFAALGARIAAGELRAAAVGWIVDMGTDFPPEVKATIDSWGTGAVFRRGNRLTSRGKNVYGANEHRAFEYTTPKKRIDVADLAESPWLMLLRLFHLICLGDRASAISRGIVLAVSTADPPVFVWEPVPYDCVPEMWEQCKSTLAHITVFTPNAGEAAAYFGEPEPTRPAEIEALARRFLPHLPPSGGVVLRCGAEGCYVLTATTSRWFPAFHRNGIVDPTGCGNTFVGAFATALVLTASWHEAARYGNIAAGIASETVGMPTVQPGDVWNGRSIHSRREQYARDEQDPHTRG